MTLNELGILPIRNWQTGVFSDTKNITRNEIGGVWPRKNVGCGPHRINL
jgi:hypothetical protein